MAARNPTVYVLKEGTSRTRGKSAQHENFRAARLIASLVRTTMGPRGMDKMLVNTVGDMQITNDGATILSELELSHPAAKMMVEVAKTMDTECGDGTTSAVVLAGELLKMADELIEKNVHPTVISNGYRMAEEKALEALDSLTIPVKYDDVKTMRRIAATAMMSKAVTGDRQHLANIAVEAVRLIAEQRNGKRIVNLRDVQIVKRQGATTLETEFVKGVIIDREPVSRAMPTKIEGARIALISGPMEVAKTQVDEFVEVSDPDELNAFIREEESMLRKQVEMVKACKANVIFCGKGIDDRVQYDLAVAGVLAFRKISEGDLDMLAKATGADIVTKPDELEAKGLGQAEMVNVREYGEKELAFVTGCKNPKAVSIFIRGTTTQVADEIERSLNDALSVVRLVIEDGKMTVGGGATAMELSMRLREYASSVGTREQMAIKLYADALEVIPIALAENAGRDRVNALIDLRKAHKNGEVHAGLDVFTGVVVDMKEMEVLEPYKVARQTLISATELAVMLVRIDSVIAAKGAPENSQPLGL
jgi:thermosome